MFDISIDNGRVVMNGRLDASQVEKARELMDTINDSVEVDIKGLEYISSAGLGLFINIHLKLTKNGHKMTVTNPNNLVKNIFHLSRLDEVIEIK